MTLPVGRELALEPRGQLRTLRPRSDERHLPAQHVDQLRELVEPPRADPAAGRDDALVADAREHGATVLLRTDAHRAELDHGEVLASRADTDLTEQERTASREQLVQRDEQEQREPDGCGEQRVREVEDALEAPTRHREPPVAQQHERKAADLADALEPVHRVERTDSQEQGDPAVGERGDRVGVDLLEQVTAEHEDVGRVVHEDRGLERLSAADPGDDHDVVPVLVDVCISEREIRLVPEHDRSRWTLAP